MSAPAAGKRPLSDIAREAEANGRASKRRAPHTRAPSPPPVSPPSSHKRGETVYRILCPASKTGSIIGKAGSIIKSIRQDTGAMIRIEDAVFGCDERVVTVSAKEEGFRPQKFRGPGNYHKPGDEDNDDLMSETDDEEEQPDDAVGQDSEEKVDLAAGLDGEKLAEEEPTEVDSDKDKLTGAESDKEKLPEAEQGIANLTEGEPDKEKLIESGKEKPTETAKDNVDMESSAVDKLTEAAEKESTEVIGVKLEQVEGKASEVTSESKADGKENGKEEALLAEESGIDLKDRGLSPVQEALLRVHLRILEADPSKPEENQPERGQDIVTRLLVPTSQVGCLLGKQGKIVSQMREESGAQIRVLPKDQLPICASRADEVVQKSFEVYCDACGRSLGAVLMQEGRVIAYESRMFSKPKMTTQIYEKELLAVIHALTQWRHYLLGADFTVFTDHQSLCYFLSQKQFSEKQMRRDGYREEGSSSQDRQSIPIVHEVGEGSSQTEEGFPHAAFSITGTASPGTVFRGMQGMVPNPMYANIGMQPRFWGTQGQFGVSQGNLGRLQKKAADCHQRDLKLKENDWVLLRLEKARLRKKKKGKERLYPKLSMRYYGPFQITEHINDISFRLRLPDTWKIHNVFHVNLWKAFGDVPDDGEPDEQPEVEENEEILVPEQVLAHKVTKKGLDVHIYFVVFVCQITGDLTAVRKALLAVSTQLRNNPPKRPGEDSKAMSHLPEEFTRKSGGGRVKRTSARSSPRQPLGQSSGLTLSFGEEEVTFRIMCPKEKIGSIIGKGGSIVQSIREETGAKISIDVSSKAGDERVIRVSAQESREDVLSKAQRAVMILHSRILAADQDKDGLVTVKLLVPADQAGCLLGKGGSIVIEMRKLTRAKIHIYGKEHLPPCALRTDELVEVVGKFNAAQEALMQITTRLRNNLFHGMAGPGYGPSFRDPKIPPYSGLASPNEGPLTLRTQMMPAAASYDRYRAPYQDVLSTLTGPHSHGPWQSQPVQSYAQDVRSKALPDLLGLGHSRELGAEPKRANTAFITSQTVEVIVPEHTINSIVGESGSNLQQICKISGARVKVNGVTPGALERVVEISGTPDQTHAAQSLLQAFILSGQ
ncbi:hypothetical protein L7F22_063072 [Adiantum nelumboides]|nr:hypothetical protein [Adiantum nelumboides]